MRQPGIPVLTEVEAVSSANVFAVPGTDVLCASAVPNARMKNVRRLIEQITGYTTNVLLTGEPGSGKEWVARYLHAASPRRDRNFVPVNCGAIHEDQLESELFGHEKGAIEGAITSRIGRLEAAAGGTLFLHDVADISTPVQIRLARALEERSFRRIGGDRDFACNFRLIAATQRDLEQAVCGGAFHAELYYKLKVFPIEMPPLRERIEDLASLVKNIQKLCAESGMQAIDLTPGSMRILKHYDWPGNIKELTDLIERLCVLYPGGRVDIPNLPPDYTAKAPLRNSDREGIRTARASGSQPQDFELPDGNISLKSYLENVEIAVIRRALHETNGVIAHAARHLQIRRTTLAEKMKRYGIKSRDNTGAI